MTEPARDGFLLVLPELLLKLEELVRYMVPSHACAGDLFAVHHEDERLERLEHVLDVRPLGVARVWASLLYDPQETVHHTVRFVVVPARSRVSGSVISYPLALNQFTMRCCYASH